MPVLTVGWHWDKKKQCYHQVLLIMQIPSPVFPHAVRENSRAYHTSLAHWVPWKLYMYRAGSMKTWAMISCVEAKWRKDTETLGILSLGFKTLL